MDTPSGLPVLNAYFKVRKPEITVLLYNCRLKAAERGPRDKVDAEGQVDERLTFRVYEQTDKLDSRKQTNALCPNLIHSLDASHLALTIARAKAAGLNDLLTIHDCFATHAGNLGSFRGYSGKRLSNCTRPTTP